MNREPKNAPKGNILIVDDTPDNLRLLSTMLAQQGYKVRKAISGILAISAAKNAPPDIIMLDIDMPQMNGYEVCQHLKADAKTSHIPVIFISVLGEALDKVKAFSVGGADYITKPFQIEEVLARIQNQLSIRQLQIQLQKINANLESQVEVKTAQLQQALRIEELVRRITEKIRDNLDESQILQTAVQELALSTGAYCCNAALYDLERQTSTICYEYTSGGEPLFQGMVVEMASFPEGYRQLLQGQHFQFCSIAPVFKEGRAAVLSCPILDDNDVLGDLWLFHNQPSHAFSEQDIRLVQQVASQCAIALRQSRLYQAAQTQVRELERLNRLKDDFLSTVSHELRTPMSNINMTIQMLEMTLESLGVLDAEFGLVSRHFQNLKDECQRESNLIDDLLDLSRLDAGTEPLILTTLSLQDWIPHIAEAFAERALSQQQSLQFDLPADLPPLTTDFSYMERILTELLNNACKYTPPEQIIIISAYVTEAGVRLSISNSGIEIPASELANVFDKFYRVPSNDPWKHTGIGLGLALVKKRVEQLQGTVEVTSQHGWTTFTVQLPWSVKHERLGCVQK